MLVLPGVSDLIDFCQEFNKFSSSVVVSSHSKARETESVLPCTLVWPGFVDGNRDRGTRDNVITNNRTRVRFLYGS